MRQDCGASQILSSAFIFESISRTPFNPYTKGGKKRAMLIGKKQYQASPKFQPSFLKISFSIIKEIVTITNMGMVCDIAAKRSTSRSHFSDERPIIRKMIANTAERKRDMRATLVLIVEPITILNQCLLV